MGMRRSAAEGRGTGRDFDRFFSFKRSRATHTLEQRTWCRVVSMMLRVVIVMLRVVIVMLRVIIVMLRVVIVMLRMFIVMLREVIVMLRVVIVMLRMIIVMLRVVIVMPVMLGFVNDNVFTKRFGLRSLGTRYPDGITVYSD